MEAFHYRKNVGNAAVEHCFYVPSKNIMFALRRERRSDGFFEEYRLVDDLNRLYEARKVMEGTLRAGIWELRKLEIDEYFLDDLVKGVTHENATHKQNHYLFEMLCRFVDSSVAH